MDYIKSEFLTAQSRGWLPSFESAGKEFDFNPTLLMAIASRETNMRNIIGDSGHGYGLMQIDKRSYPQFCSSGEWKDVAKGIRQGALVLDAKRTQIKNLQGKPIRISVYSTLGMPIDDHDLLVVSIAAYNCGLWSYYSYSKDGDPDRYTTGRNYSHDVISRQVEFDLLLKGATE